jgi:hypothetical protein
MEEKRKCRKCLLREDFPEDYKKYVKTVLDKLSEKEKVSSEEYHRRLKQCLLCGQLQNGTCMSCGCMVEIRAAQKSGYCPEKNW